MDKQPEALVLARAMESIKNEVFDFAPVGTELRRLYKVNQELVEALEEVVRTFESNPSSISDTVWITGEVSETLYDHCCAALAKHKEQA